MKVRHLILMLLEASGGKIASKTKIQKEVYFISLLLGRDLGFKPHYYGPYSPEIEQGLDELIGAGFVDMTRHILGVDAGRGFEFKRYDFTLAESGRKLVEFLKNDNIEEYKKIKEFIKNLKEINDPDYLTLSVAAKCYFILNKEGKAMNRDAVKEKANFLRWNVTSEDIDKAVTILKKLDFVVEDRVCY